MAFYGKHHIVRYSIAAGMDTSKPQSTFLDKSQIKINKQQSTTDNDKQQAEIPIYFSNTSIVDNKAQGLTLPTCLDGHFVDNGRSILCINTDDSKTFSLFSINSKGQSKKFREFSLNTYYENMLFSTDQSFCLLLEDIKDRTLMHRKLCISYVFFSDGDIHGQVHRNALEVEFNCSFSLINQHKYQLSPCSKFLAIVHFTNTRKLMNLVMIEKQVNGLRLTNTIQLDLSDDFLWNYLKEIKFNSTEDKILLITSRTVKQDNVVLCSLKNSLVQPLEFVHTIRKQDSASYHFANDYMHKDVLIRASTCGQVEVKKLTDSSQRNVKEFHLKNLNLSKQFTCFATHAGFKRLNLYAGTSSGEIFVIDVNKCTVRSKIAIGNHTFCISSLYINWSGTEVFALEETGKKTKANVRVSYIPNRRLLTLQEIAAKTVLENFPMKQLKALGIPKPLRYFLY